MMTGLRVANIIMAVTNLMIYAVTNWRIALAAAVLCTVGAALFAIAESRDV